MNLLKEIEGASIKRTLRHVSVDESRPAQQAPMKPSDVLKNVRAGEGRIVKPSAIRSAAFGSMESRAREPSKLEEKRGPFAMEQHTPTTEPKRAPFTKTVSQPQEERIITATRSRLQGEGWEERMTVDGVPYYYNKSTDCLSWEKPDCLRTEEEKKEGSTHWAWLEDEGAWVPVCVVVV